MPQLARWLTIEQLDYEVIHREGRKHGNAHGLSRRPPVNELETKFSIEGEISEVRNPGIPSASAKSIRSSDENEVEERSVETELAEDSIRVIREHEGGINLLVGESLPKRQQEDPDV